MSKVQGRSLRTPAFSPTSLYPQTQRLDSETWSLVHAVPLLSRSGWDFGCTFLASRWQQPPPALLHLPRLPLDSSQPVLALPGLLTLLRIFLWLPVYTAENPVCPQVLSSSAPCLAVFSWPPLSQCASLCNFPFVPVFPQVHVVLPPLHDSHLSWYLLSCLFF